jgi:ATP synthase protein I
MESRVFYEFKLLVLEISTINLFSLIMKIHTLDITVSGNRLHVYSKKTSGDKPMLDLHHVFAMQKKALLFLLAFCALGWGFTPYEPIFLGIAVGALFGTYNFWILVRRMDKFDRNLSEGKRTPSIGMALRFGSGIAAAAIAITLPQYINLGSTIIGLMAPYVFLLIGAIMHSVKEQKGE